MAVTDLITKRRTAGRADSKGTGQSATRSADALSLSELLPQRTSRVLPTRLFWA
jgi:hypothetical protein